MDTFQTFLNACRNGQKSIAKLLLERGGIDLNRRDAEGNTALHYACREGYRDLAVLLLEKDCQGDALYEQADGLLRDRSRREEMVRALNSMAVPDAGEKIYQTLREIMEARRTK